MMPAYQILPSILGADLGSLAAEIARAAAAGADALHVDIMDPHFVPNISFGPSVVALARRVAPSLRRNVHLMMSRPDAFLEKFVSAGADSVQIHVEAGCDVRAALARIRALGAENAIVLNPETPVESVLPLLGEVDGAMVMTVHPGYGGQAFIPECLDKVRRIRAAAPELDIMIDGGGDGATIPLAARAGANQFVSGNWLFSRPDMKSAIESLRRSLP